tara:strand:+ start:1019 stop:1402 length:384 start_codon:yes stop_codon:yes gene_type:complete
MGFFSGECKSCGLSIISPYALNDELIDAGGQKLTEMVYLTEKSIIMGIYGGYGDAEIDTGIYVESGSFFTGDDSQAIVYHKCCWEYEGKPSWDEVETKGVNYSSDQGYFLNDEDYIKTMEMHGSFEL